DTITPDEVKRAKGLNLVHRLVAECEVTADGFVATVGPTLASLDHPFGRTKGTENCLFIETETREKIVVRGRGAGRHATTESVIADLFDVRDVINSSPTDNQFRRAAA